MCERKCLLVSILFNLKIDKEKVREIFLVDFVFMVLKVVNMLYYYCDLMNEVVKQCGMIDEEINEFIVQLYIEINIDGCFVCVGISFWGLKCWYLVGGIEDFMMGVKCLCIINDEDDDLEDEDFGEEEDSYNSDEDFDNVDDD